MLLRSLCALGWPLLLPGLLAADVTRGQPAADPFAAEPTLAAADSDAVRDQALAWLAQRGASAEVQQHARQLWADTARLSDSALDRLAATLALGDARIAALQKLCSAAASPGPLPQFAWLGEGGLDAFARDNLRLYYGRWLSRHRYYDEALEQLTGLEPEKVVDPASLFFHRAVCHHRLLHKQAGLAEIARLLDDVHDPPLRFRRVAALMQQDLQQLRDESLDHASRLMDDIGRRLELGRAGQRVQKVQGDVIAVLDKLIEQMEDQGPGRGGTYCPGGPPPPHPPECPG